LKPPRRDDCAPILMPAVAQASVGREESRGTFRSEAKRKLLACLLLVAGALWVYGSASRNGFVNYDDDRYVLTNPHVRAGLHWSTVRWAFTSFDEANWHPVTWLSHALDCQLFQLNAARHHQTNVLLHAANAALLFLLLAAATKSIWRSFFVAALFAVHPIQVESVAWVAERKNVLAMFFFLLTLLAYTWYARKAGAVRYFLVAGFCALGLMSKPLVITLPFVLFLLDYWPLQRLSVDATDSAGVSRFWKLCLEKLPLLVMSVASAVVTMLAQKAGGAVTSNTAHTPFFRVENALVCYVLYLGKALWPAHLAVLYPYPRLLPTWEIIASVLLLLLITAAVIKFRERRYLTVGWFWYLGTMIPMIGLVQVGNQAMADRYAYLPFVGLFIVVVWMLADWAEGKSWRETAAGMVSQRRISAKLLASAVLCVVITFAALARMQVTYWHDDLSLWTHALANTQSNFVAENNVGTILARQGRDDEAVIHFRNASVLEPGDPVSQLNLGIYAQTHGDSRQAIARYQAALQLATDSRIRAAAYANLGQVFCALGDFPRARENYEGAARLNNPFPLQLGVIAQKMDDWNGAIRYYSEVVAAEPSDVAFLLLAQAFKSAGRDADARRAYEQAGKVSTDLPQAQQIVDKLIK
jgi:Flp pilus assembly protein TadD